MMVAFVLEVVVVVEVVGEMVAAALVVRVYRHRYWLQSETVVVLTHLSNESKT